MCRRTNSSVVFEPPCFGVPSRPNTHNLLLPTAVCPSKPTTPRVYLYCAVFTFLSGAKSAMMLFLSLVNTACEERTACVRVWVGVGGGGRTTDQHNTARNNEA